MILSMGSGVTGMFLCYYFVFMNVGISGTGILKQPLPLVVSFSKY